MLAAAWRAGVYHLWLEAIDATRSMMATADKETDSRIRQVLESPESRHLGLSTTLVEVMAS